MPPHPPPKAETSPRTDSAAPGRDQIAILLADVATGRRSVADALAKLAETDPDRPNPAPDESFAAAPPAGESIDRVTLDLDRQRRCGFPEVIYGQGKPAEMISAILRRQHEAGQDSFATRIDAATADRVRSAFPDARYNPIARTLSTGHAAALPKALPRTVPGAPNGPAGSDDVDVPPHVAVITAGSTDAPVAEESIETLHWMGIRFRGYDDIGVAGPQRLLDAVPDLRQATAVVVIAGMEGALPAAVGGHLDVPIFAVPTSVGYGVTLGGLTPLFGMLSSCASNVAVVNIDAGFKAAYLAGLVLRPHLNPAE